MILLYPLAIEFFYGPYASSRKEPDLLVRPDNQRLPSIVTESGWSESLPRLHDDMNLWLVGGNGSVKATLILKWHKIGHSNVVRGHAELYTLDTNGMPILRQEEVIFPAPPPSTGAIPGDTSSKARSVWWNGAPRAKP